MQHFHCAVCGQSLFYENVLCTRCGHTLAFLPDLRTLSPLEAVEAPAGESASNGPAIFTALVPEAQGATYRLCGNYSEFGVCNWAVPADDDNPLCEACRLNRVVPDASDPAAREKWQRLEIAKRRLLYTLFALGLPIQPVSESDSGLAFSFLEDRPEKTVTTGHADGLVTINVSEADDAYRERMREEMGEAYRTLLGHVRHEAGHYYWDRLIRESAWLESFRQLFGDERPDYGEAMKRHYEQGPPAHWQDSHVSAYAAMHPWEDWAETFAHYLHMVDTLDTAANYGVSLEDAASDIPTDVDTPAIDNDSFDELIAAWVPLTVALNSFNRSMGLPDIYPFVLAEPAIEKLRFVHSVIQGATPTATIGDG
ncbi:MAG: putative zinc-binding peptidase [Pirellulales bacterium]